MAVNPEEKNREEPSANAGTDEKEKGLEALEKELALAIARGEENLAGWQRAQADLSNYKKRVEQERKELTESACSALILRLLPVLDDFERAEGSIPEESKNLPWVDGIRIIEKSLRQILEREGLTPIEAEGEPFDPCLHEAVSCCPGKEGMVIKEVKKGYTVNGRLLRPACVIVGEGEKPEKSEVA